MSDVWIHPDIAYFLGPQGVSPQTVRDAYQNTFCSPGAWGGNLNKQKTTHFRRSGNEWFSHFVHTNALLAPLQNSYVFNNTVNY